MANEPSEAQKLAMGLDRPRAVRDTRAAIDYIRNSELSNGNVAVIGYCLGGGVSLLTATQDDGVAATVVYYGGIPDSADQLDSVSSPVLAIYGSDEGERADQLESELNAPRQVRPEAHLRGRDARLLQRLRPGPPRRGFRGRVGKDHRVPQSERAGVRHANYIRTLCRGASRRAPTSFWGALCAKRGEWTWRRLERTSDEVVADFG